MTISEGELYFFNTIKDECKVVFDVGVQKDIHYIEIAPELEYHLFEPNLEFCEEIKRKLLKYPNSNVKVNPFGLGRKTESLLYYPDSQSFFLRKVHMQSNPNLAVTFNIKSFKEYVEENNIKFIDFLKIDTEGGEPDILFPNYEYIKENVKYVQFEYASTWYDRDDNWELFNVYNFYKDKFKLYYLYNSAHPVSKLNLEMLTEIKKLDDLRPIEDYVFNQYGFEIVMVRR